MNPFVGNGRSKRGVGLAMALAAILLASACGPAKAESQAPTTSAAPDQTPTPTPSASATPSTPVTVLKTVTETVAIPFKKTSKAAPTLTSGKRVISVKGIPGVKTLTFEVTFVDGVQSAKKLLSDVVTKAPTTEVTLVGTKPKSKCDPNYSGACVPIASDVDCAGGGGNGPAYVSGPVYVIGTDIYKLDSDHDGVGCE